MAKNTDGIDGTQTENGPDDRGRGNDRLECATLDALFDRSDEALLATDATGTPRRWNHRFGRLVIKGWAACDESFVEVATAMVQRGGEVVAPATGLAYRHTREVLQVDGEVVGELHRVVSVERQRLRELIERGSHAGDLLEELLRILDRTLHFIRVGAGELEEGHPAVDAVAIAGLCIERATALARSGTGPRGEGGTAR